MFDMSSRSVAIVGAGIAGLAAAEQLTRDGDIAVTLFERSDRVGGKLVASPFAGLAHVDESADAFLARVPDATNLAATVGISNSLVHPEAVGAAVWYNQLHPIPDGLLLGVPGKLGPLARTGLISWKGKLRAGLEPMLPRQSLEHDSVGQYVRGRFGAEVHERLVDALVGSIYATDTDQFSLAEVPQLHALATGHRSALLGARRTRAAGTASASASPIFASPASGLGSLATATADHAVTAGLNLRLGHPVDTIQESGSGNGWELDGQRFDAVIVATPARAAASTLNAAAPAAARGLADAEAADVVLVTLHIDADEWPDRLAGRSGYLIPKPVQRSITAVSFGTQKWAHWAPPTGGQILRVSLGRDGKPVLHLTDEDIIARVLDDLDLHLGVRFTPREVRVSRWPGAFAQYRPHHRRWVDDIEATLPAGIFLAGASYRGIGVPACIRNGRTIAGQSAQFVRSLT
jgi:oxygen-dependent protoporphyrinogen oxidase